VARVATRPSKHSFFMNILFRRTAQRLGWSAKMWGASIVVRVSFRKMQHTLNSLSRWASF